MINHNEVHEEKRSLNDPEVVTFGESMGLFTPFGTSKGLEHASLLDISFGGAESNVAIGLARMGHRAGWFGSLGDDPMGHRILKAIRGEGVDVSRAVLRQDASTGFMMRESLGGASHVYYYRRSSAASRMSPADLDLSYIGRARILHITGITPALSPSCAEAVLSAVQSAKAQGVKISFDPNLRLKLWTAEEARPILLELAALSDYFLPGWDELKLLYQSSDEKVIMDRIRSLTAVTVIKSVQDSVWLVQNGEVHAEPFHRIGSVVDPIGAGDGFAAGFLSGLLEGLTPVEAVRLGNAVGACVVQTPGDWESLPERSRVDGLMNKIQQIER